jgi:hypothetical protein
MLSLASSLTHISSPTHPFSHSQRLERDQVAVRAPAAKHAVDSLAARIKAEDDKLQALLKSQVGRTRALGGRGKGFGWERQGLGVEGQGSE